MEALQHREAILKIFDLLHEPWMDDEDKRMFNETMMLMYGDELNHGFEGGIKKGFSIELQLKSTIDYLHKNPDSFGFLARTHGWYRGKYETVQRRDMDPILYRDFSDIREALERV